MKSAFLHLLLTLLFVPSAHATLGEKSEDLTASTSAQVKVLHTPQTTFRRIEKTQPLVRVREFAGADGKVFAVSWSGQRHPDLSVLLGRHFETYKIVLHKARRLRRGHSPLMIDADGMHLEMGGPQRMVSGRIWLQDSLPAGVDLNDLQ